MEIKELKKKIRGLISQNDQDYKKVKDRYTFLYEKKAETEELETIDRLRRFQGGNEYLKAYLMYKSISRANYQMEHLKLTGYDIDEQGQDRLLKAINADVDNLIKNSEKSKKLPIAQPTNEQLLIMLGERLSTGEIKRELGTFGNYLMIENEQGILKVDLHDGKITPDPVKGFLKKHGFIIDEPNGESIGIVPQSSQGNQKDLVLSDEEEKETTEKNKKKNECDRK